MPFTVTSQPSLAQPAGVRRVGIKRRVAPSEPARGPRNSGAGREASARPAPGPAQRCFFKVTVRAVVCAAPWGLRARIVTLALMVCDLASSCFALELRCSVRDLTWPPAIVKDTLARVRIDFFDFEA